MICPAVTEFVTSVLRLLLHNDMTYNSLTGYCYNLLRFLHYGTGVTFVMTFKT